MQPIDESVNKLKEGIANMPGYRLPDTHYRLGSKIHISQFYYAKRMFQNSYFASKFAFLVSRFIYKEIEERIQNGSIKELTLIGYGLYSELMLSFIRKFLDILSDNKVNTNTNLVNDSDTLELVKGKKDIHKNVFIIVPIASTFSTSIKIQEKLNDILQETRKDHKDKEINVLSPHINVLAIINQADYETPGIIDKENISPVARSMRWKKINKPQKTITVEGIDGTETTLLQKYFLELPGEWHLISNCKLCFPEISAGNSDVNCTCRLEQCMECSKKEEKCVLNERGLYTTDKASVTPMLIFDSPKPRSLCEGEKMIITTAAITYGHRVHNKKHYKYYFNSQIFFSENQPQIKRWLEEKWSDEKKTELAQKQVLIFAPGHFTNTSFVDLVNSVLFSNTATIVHYDTSNEHIQNFSLFYKKNIDDADIIYFVDDFLVTGESFFRTNHLLRQCNNKKWFNECIVMLNRTSWDIETEIIGELEPEKGRLMAYSNLYLLPLNDSQTPCPLCGEVEKYKKLLESSFLNRTRLYLKRQIYKIRKNEPLYEGAEGDGDHNVKYIRRVEAIHRTYSWFSNPDNQITTESFYEWEENLIKSTESPFMPYERDQRIFERKSRLDENNCELLKVLTQNPFCNYVSIRDKTFKWVLHLLFDQILLMKREMDSNSGLHYESLRDLKFLMRRAALLRMNILISGVFLDFLRLFFKKGFDQIKKNAANLFTSVGGANLFTSVDAENLRIYVDKVNSDLTDFHIYYIGQVKELLFEDEIKSIHLERMIDTFESNEYNKNEEQQDVRFVQLLRLLRYENSGFIKSQRDFRRSHSSEISYHKNIVFNESVERDEMTMKLFEKYEDVGKISKPCGEHIEDQIKCILNNLKKFIGYWNGKNFIEYSDVGSFILMSSQWTSNPQAERPDGTKQGCDSENRNCKLIYNQGEPIEENMLTEDLYLRRFINGIEDHVGSETHISIIEFEGKNGIWKDLYSGSDCEQSDLKIPTEKYNRLLLLRISKPISTDSSDVGTNDDALGHKQEKEQGSTLAVIGFLYTATESRKMVEAKATRYLRMLSDELCAFFQNHIDTHEFLDYYAEKHKQRLALLMTHGKSMLENLANDAESNKNDRYRYRIIGKTLEHLQFIIMHYDQKDRKKRINDFFFDDELDLEETISELAEMYQDVVKNKFVECRLSDEVKCPAKNSNEVQSDKQIFKFSKKILDVICFELFVNAKKNRWHFKDYTQKEGKNSFSMDYEYDGHKKQLKIIISNTGPNVLPRELNQMNRICNAEEKPISGLGLIRTILSDLDIGTLYFKAPDFNDKLEMVDIQAVLTLNASASCQKK